MIIFKDVFPFVLSSEGNIKEAIQKIENNKHKIVYVVDERNHLLGCLADGDFRRWSLDQQDVIDLTLPVTLAYNSNCRSLNIDSSPAEIEQSLSSKGGSMPLVDSDGHLVAIAERGAKFVTINNRRISDEDPVYVIAEIGNNHQGDLSVAKSMIKSAAECGVDCVKFQMRTMSSLYLNSDSDNEEADLGAQYTFDLLNRFQLSDRDLFESFDYCKSMDVTPLCTPWDLASLAKLEEYGLPGYKVASADFTNFELLEAISETGKPMICSTGMCSEDDIRRSIEFLEKKKALYVLLHCNSTYPTPFKDINIRYLRRLREASKGIVGYSGHERGWAAVVAAVSLGAKVIEKHFTFDKTLEGNDHKVSLIPSELEQMVKDIRSVEEALGTDGPRNITQGEMMNREVLAKSLVAVAPIKVGEIIKREMIGIKSPGKGLQPNRIDALLGKHATRDLRKNDIFYLGDIIGQTERKHRYSFSRPYGIPVRYHDYQVLTQEQSLDFIEFHLSYKDLDVAVNRFVEKNDNLGFAVHAPELFGGDHLLDLTTSDVGYLNRSIAELKRVINHTLELREYFPKTKKPIIVVNVGGWSVDNFLSKDEVLRKYDILKNTLNSIDLESVTLAIQTMPPFPWHFGGQSHHNLFVDAEEIAIFCEDSNFSICLDISHSMMACNYYKTDLYEFVRKVAPYVVHMHIVDAKGADGEGVQIGEGDVDFRKLGRLLDDQLPNVPFIPEIWQGHKNEGAGFWKALAYLESKFSNPK